MKSNVATERLKQPGFVINVDQTGSRQKVSALLATNWLRLSSLTLLAFCIRLLMVKYSWGLDGDGVWYATLGKNLVSGNFKAGLSAYWPPLYPFLVGISSLVIHDLEFAGRFVSVLAGSLLVIPVYYLCLKLYDKEVAFIGALLVAIHSLLINYSTSLMTESTYTLLFTSAIVLGLFALSKARVYLFPLTGLAFGACYLVRPEAMGYVGLIILLTMAARLYNKRIQNKRVFHNSVLLITVLILTCFPYILYVHHQTGVWTISQKLSLNLRDSDIYRRRLTPDGQSTNADILWGGFRPQSAAQFRPSGPPPAADSGNRPGTVRRLAYVLEQSAKGLAGEYGIFPQVVSPLFVLFAGLGLFTTRWSKHEAGFQLYLLLFVLATLLGYSLTVLQVRYLLPLLPIFLCWSARGVIVFESWLVETVSKASKSIAQFLQDKKLGRVFVVALLLISVLPLTTGFIHHAEGEPKSVAVWIKEHSNTPPVIMASGPWAAFWSGGKHLYLPNEEYPVVIDYARRKGVKYLIIEEQQISRTWHLKFLLDGEDQRELRLVHKHSSPSPYQVLVYEVVNQSVSGQTKTP